MGKLYVNRINPTTGSIVTVDAHARITGDLEVTGTFKAKATDFVVNANSTVLGDANSDVTTVTSQLTASEGIAATKDVGVGNLIYHVGDTDTRFEFTDDDIIVKVGGQNFLQLEEDTISNFKVNPTGYDLDFSVLCNVAATPAIFVSGSDGVAHSGYGIKLADDKKLIFGKNSDATIEYDEDGTDELRFAGAAVTFEQNVSFDEDVTLGLTQDDVTTVASQLTASEGITLSDNSYIADDKKLYFGSGNDASIEYDEDGDNELKFAGAAVAFAQNVSFDEDVTLGLSQDDVTTVTSQLTASEGIMLSDNSYVADDKKLYFGNGNDASIEYDEDGDDELKFAGAAVAFAQNVSFDGNVILGDANADVVTVTSRLTASEGMTVAASKRINIGAAEEYIYGDGTDIHFGVGSNGDINIPASIGLTFGNDGEKIEGSGTDLRIYSGDLLVDTENTIILDAGSNGSILLKDDAVQYGNIKNNSLTLEISASAQAGAAGSGDIKLIGGSGASDITLAAGGDIILSASGGDVMLKDGSTQFLKFTNNAGDVEVYNGVADKDIIFKDLGGNEVFRVDGSEESILVASGKELQLGAEQEYLSGDGSTLSIVSEDGSIAIGAALADGQTVKLGKNGAVETIIAPHGTAGSELYSVTNTAGTAANAVSLNATAGGITFNSDATTAQDAVTIDASQTTKNALQLNGTALTTGDAISIDANVLTTGNALFIDHDDAHTDAQTVVGVHYDFDKAGTTANSTVQSFTGLDVDLSDAATNHTGSTVVMTGLDIDVDSASTQGANTNVGADILVTDATTNYGLVITAEDGAGSDILLQSSADTGDYCSIAVGNHGATTIATVDDDSNDDADLTLDADGKIVIEAKDGDEVVFNEGDNDVDFRVETVDETHMIFVEGSSNRVSIGDSVDSPAATLEITNHASAGAYGVPLLQLNSNDTDKVAVDINAANIDANVLDITADALTTATAIEVTTDARTTGTALNISDSNTSDSAGSLVKIAQTGSRAGTAASIGLDIDFDTVANANARALRIDSEQTTGVVAELDGNAVTTGNVLSVSANALTSGDAASISSNSSDTTARAVLKLTNDHASATGASVLEIDQDSTGPLISAAYGSVGSNISLKVHESTGTVSGGGATTTTVSNAIPANSVMVGAAVRVTTTFNNGHITKIGVAGDDDFLVAADATGGSAANVLKDGVLEQADDTVVFPWQPANNNFVILQSASDMVFTHTSCTAGAVRVAVYYYDITPPTE
jgi:hypothetical protein